MTNWWNEPGAAPLPHAAVTLLNDVEAAFAVTGARTPGWEAPEEDPEDDWYSRVTDPGRFAIIASRAQAWITVLTERGWARSWTRGSRRLLVPVRRGAVPLTLDVAVHEGITFLEISVGDPPLHFTVHPDCACDACDQGSQSLLQEIDQDIFSVVDGSLEIVEGAGKRSLRTSFRGQWGASGGKAVRGVAGGPWAQEWRPRALVRPYLGR